MAIAQALVKIQYDELHQSLDLKVGDKPYLRLHHDYTISGVMNRKLSHQRTGPFTVLAKVGKLTCRLEIPSIMEIWPAISVAQLESYNGPDPYNRIPY